MKKRTSWIIIVLSNILTALINTCVSLYFHVAHSIPKPTLLVEDCIFAITLLTTGIITIKLLRISKSKYHVFKKILVFILSYIVIKQLIWLFAGISWVIAIAIGGY